MNKVTFEDFLLVNKAKTILKDLREQGKKTGARYLKPDDIKQCNEWLMRFKDKILPFVDNSEQQQLNKI